MDFFIQGELFLRKKRDSLKTIRITPEMFEDFTPANINDLFNHAINFGETTYIYQLIMTETGPKMRYRDNDGKMSPLTPVTFEDIENNYISLPDFFKESNFIGRQAKITTNYHDPGKYDERLLLYKGYGHVLTYDFTRTDSLFKRIIPIQIYDVDHISKIELEDNRMDLYSNPSDLYYKLYSEILNSTKEEKKKFDNENGNNNAKK